MIEAEIRAEERARIAAWLRVPVAGDSQWLHDALAEMIEQADHWRPGQGLPPPYRTKTGTELKGVECSDG